MRFLFTAVIAAGLVNGATIYTVVDLGPFVGGGAPLVGGTPTTNLGVLPGGSWSAAYGTNASGALTGYGDTSNGHFRAFVWTPTSGMTMLGTLGGLDSWGMGINDSGDVAGHSTVASGYIHAFLWSGGQLEDLGTLGGTSSYGYGINNSDFVVGSGDLPDGSIHAFLSSGGVMLDLNTLIAANSGWVLDGAYSIDNGGRIIGTGSHDGQSREFELDPGIVSQSQKASATPEPSTFVLLGIGLVVLGRFSHTTLNSSLKP
jgi:probable HAF family extracellular repeat protein